MSSAKVTFSNGKYIEVEDIDISDSQWKKYAGADALAHYKKTHPELANTKPPLVVTRVELVGEKDTAPVTDKNKVKPTPSPAPVVPDKKDNGKEAEKKRQEQVKADAEKKKAEQEAEQAKKAAAEAEKKARETKDAEDKAAALKAQQEARIAQEKAEQAKKEAEKNKIIDDFKKDGEAKIAAEKAAAEKAEADRKEKEINAFSSYWKKHDVHRLPKNPEGLPAVPRVKPRLFSKRPLGFRGGAAAVKELPQDFIDVTECADKDVTE